MVKQKKYLRFSVAYRFEHWVLAIDFILLAITGLVQMFSRSVVSIWIISLFGGIENVRLVHHICAVIMILETLLHIGLIRYRAYARLSRRRIMPGLSDLQTAIQAFLYNIGFTKERPKEGRYTFAEKAEYWAVVWGTLIMVITGFMMWNPVATTRYLPGEFVPAAKMAHGGEAILAVLAIIVWHFYFVLFRQVNPSMFTGYLTEEQMLAEHPLELEDIEAGVADLPSDPALVNRFWRFCFPQYLLICIIVLIAAYFFVTFENTAIRTVAPAEDVTIFSPLPPTPGRGPLITDAGTEEAIGFETTIIPGEFTWESGISELFSPTCTGCHGASAAGGLNLTDYRAVMESGVITPGDPEASRLLLTVASGNHYAQLSEEALDSIMQWISEGATSESESAEVEGEAELEEEIEEAEFEPPDLTWASGIADIFSTNCGSCHGAGAMGGLNLTDYQAAMDSGVIVAGNPGSSRLIQKMEAGGHPGSLPDEDLATVRRWIENGALSGDIEPEEEEIGEVEIAEEEEIEEEPEMVEEIETEEEETAGGIPLYYWDTDIRSVFESRCTMCHGSAAVAGYDFRTFESLMGTDLIVAGDPDSSPLIQKIEIENHPGTLTGEELSMIRAWVWNGALESEGGGVTVETEADEAGEEEAEPESLYTWDSDISAILAASCTSCHGEMAVGGLDLRTLESVMDAGVIARGDPSGSSLLQKIEAGDHYAQLTEEQLEIIREWILSGAR